MGSRRICVYGLEEGSIRDLPGYQIMSVAHTREDLRLAIGSADIEILIADLDQDDALNAIVEAHEIKSGLTVVGVTASNNVEFVLAAQRAGCKQIIAKPVNLNDLIVAIRGALGESTWSTEKARTISVYGSVGGAGVTTIACSLTTALAKITHAPAGIIDLDFDFGGVARAWDVKPRYTIADISATGSAEPFMIEDAMVELAGGVRALARPPTIEQGSAIDELVVERILKTAKKMFPYVVLDLPRKLDSVTGTAIQQSNKLIIVLQLTVPSVDNTSRFVESLSRFGIPLDTVEFLVNRYRKGIHTVTVADIESKFKKKVLGVLPNDFRSVASAIDIGKPISERSPFRQAIAEVASKLSGAPIPHNKKSWLSGLGRND